MVFSGGAAFGGTYLANSLNETSTSNPNSSNASSGSPSVIFQSYDNENKTAGTYEQVAEAVTPTVVEIVTESISTDTSFWGRRLHHIRRGQRRYNQRRRSDYN